MFAKLTISRITDPDTDLELSEEQLEWILNSLRMMQEHQLKMAQEAVADGQAEEHNLGDEVPMEDRYISIPAMAREAHQSITELREAIVQAVGYDLTDG